MNIYAGNLSYTTDNNALRVAFEAFGDVQSASVITDRDTGRSKGFGFVEMADQAQAQAAINGLNGKEIDGRTVTVNEAKPRSTERRSGGGGGGGGGFGGGGRRERW